MNPCTQALVAIPDARPDIRPMAGRSSLWGISPTAPIHLGLDPLIILQKAYAGRGVRHTVLLADYHAMMSHGFPVEEVNRRSHYYETYLRHCCGLDAAYVQGSSHQTSSAYVEALYTASCKLPISSIKQSLARAAKGPEADSKALSLYLYGIMQCLDCCYLGADLVIAEQGQKKIYDLLKFVCRDGRWECPEFIYLPLACDIVGRPLNQSTAKTRISIHESRESLARKIHRMYAPPGDAGTPPNPLLECFKHSVFPWRAGSIVVSNTSNRERRYGNYREFEQEYHRGLLHPNDCKAALEGYLWQRLERIDGRMGTEVRSWVELDKARGGA